MNSAVPRRRLFYFAEVVAGPAYFGRPFRRRRVLPPSPSLRGPRIYTNSSLAGIRGSSFRWFFDPWTPDWCWCISWGPEFSVFFGVGGAPLPLARSATLALLAAHGLG